MFVIYTVCAYDLGEVATLGLEKVDHRFLKLSYLLFPMEFVSVFVWSMISHM